MQIIKTGLWQAIDESYFIERFREMGRNDQFSYEGKIALFNYLEELSEDMQEPIQLDVIALCCGYSEYADLEEFKIAYDHGADIYESIEQIEEKTTVIRVDEKGFIIQAF